MKSDRPYSIQIRLQESNDIRRVWDTDSERVSIAVNCFKRRWETYKQQYESPTSEYAATSFWESFSKQAVWQLVEVQLEHVGNVVNRHTFKLLTVILWNVHINSNQPTRRDFNESQYT